MCVEKKIERAFNDECPFLFSQYSKIPNKDHIFVDIKNMPLK